MQAGWLQTKNNKWHFFSAEGKSPCGLYAIVYPEPEMHVRKVGTPGNCKMCDKLISAMFWKRKARQ